MSVSLDLNKELTEKLEKILAQFGEENGVVVCVSGVEFHTPEIVRNFAYVQSGDAIRFGEKAQRYGLSDQDYGKEVWVNNRLLRLVDCCPNRHKYPFVAEDVKGKRWKISALSAKK
jgi:hypothetical protein